MLRDVQRFFGTGTRVRVGKRQSYNVTALGKEKAEQQALTGPAWKVLAYVSEEGPASVNEIEKEVGMSNEKVRMVLRNLIENGYVQAVAQPG